MDLEKEVSITREKREARLIEEYEECLKFFEKRTFDEGVGRMRKLLQNKMIQEDDFKDLRHACFVSLGEVYEKELFLMNESMHYLHKAVALKPKDFRIWFKLGRICRYQGYFSQAEQCFLLAQQHMQGISFQNVLYQALTHLSFLSDNLTQLIQRADYLIGQNYNKNHNIALKEYAIFKEKQEIQQISQLFSRQKGRMDNSSHSMEVEEKPSTEIHEQIYNSYNQEEVIALLQEKEEIKKRQRSNLVLQRLPVALSRQNEFTIYIDKLTWSNFLKILNTVSKMFFCSQRGDATFKKDKKLNAIYSLIKSQHSLLNTVIWIKDKREAPLSEADNWNLSKKTDKQQNVIAGALPLNSQSLGSILSKDSQASNSTNGSKKKENKVVNTLKPGINPGGTKKSNRIKENNKNLNAVNLNLLVEQHIKEQASKNRFDLKEKLQNLQTEVFSKIEGVSFDSMQDQFNVLYKKLLTDGTEQEQNENRRSDLEAEEDNDDTTSLCGVNSFEKRSQLLDTYCNEDFMRFFIVAKHSPYLNLIQLIEDVLKWFLTNEDRREEISKVKDFLGQDYWFEQIGANAFSYCPNLLLNNLDNQHVRRYKTEIDKLLSKCYGMYQQQSFKHETNQLLTVFELLLEETQKIKQDHQDKELNNKKKEKLKWMHKALKWMSFEFLCSIDPHQLQDIQKIRIYHSLAIFYSDRDFEAVQFAQHAVNKMAQLLPITQLQNQLQQQDQLIEVSQTAEVDAQAFISEAQKRSTQNKKRKQFVMNMFWSNEKGISANFSEQVQDRIIENKFKKEIRKTASKLLPLGEKGDDELFIFDDEGKNFIKDSFNNLLLYFEDDAQNNLRDHLEEFLGTFEARVRERGFDDSNDLYYRNVFEILQNRKLDNLVFLEKAGRIISLLIEMSEARILDYKRTSPALEKLFRLEGICDEYLKRFPLANIVKQQQRNIEQGSKAKRDQLTINFLFLKIFITKIFAGTQPTDSSNIFSKLLGCYVVSSIHIVRSDTQSQSIAYVAFLAHDLTQQLPPSFHQEMYKSWYVNGYFSFLINNIFSYLQEREENGKIGMETEAEKKTEDQQQQQQQQQQSLELENNKSSNQDENQVPPQQEISQSNQLQQVQSLEDTNKIQHAESEDEEESDAQETDDFYESKYILETLKSIYRCFYGIKIRNSRKVQTIKYASIDNSNSCEFQSIEEIRLFVQFTMKACPQYLTNLVSPMNQQFINILVGAFDYIKKNEDEWALCPNLGTKKDEFQKYMKDKKVSAENPILDYLQQRISSQESSNQITCFCEKKDCFDLVIKPDNFLLNLLLLIGRALSQYDPRADIPANDPEAKPKFRTRRQALKNAEKMFNFFILLNPKQFLGWYSLGDVFSGLSFMYFDASVFEPMNVNVSELKDIYLSAKRVYHYILDNFINNNKITELRYLEEVREDILILNIVKMYERKSIYLISLSPVSNDYDYIRESIVKKQRITSIIEKIHNFDYDPNSPRMITLMEVFVTRSHYQKYHSATFETHFRRLKQLQNYSQEQQELQRNKKKLILSKNESQSVFKGEFYELEGLCEFCISVWKVFKRYLQLMKVIQGHCIRKDETVQRLIEDISKKQQISELSEITSIVLDDVEETINALKKIEPRLFTHVAEKEIRVEEYYQEKSRLNLKINSAIKLSSIACSILTKRIVLELEIEDCSTRISQMIEEISTILNNNFQLFNSLTQKHNNKKLKYKRFVIRSFFYSSQMLFEINNSYEKAGNTLGEIFNLKLDEIVNYYTHFENQPLEKDPKLSILYTKDLCFMLEKYKYVKLMSNLLKLSKDVEKLRALNKKTVKAMIQQYEQEVDKLNKVFKQLYLITLNDLLDVIEDKVKEDNDTHANLKKWIFELYTSNIKAKQIYKQIETDSDMTRKLKNTLIRTFCKLENIPENSDSFDNMYSRSIKFLEEVARRKKYPIVTKIIQNQEEQTNQKQKTIDEVAQDDDENIISNKQATSPVVEEIRERNQSVAESIDEEKQDNSKKREMEIEN